MALVDPTTGLQIKKKARYRWGWEKRAEQSFADDFTELFALVDRVNTNESTYTTNVEALVDIEEWMRVFALEDAAGNKNSYGNSWGAGSGTDYFGSKNMYAYKTQGGRWELLLWDLDLSLGSSQVTDDPLFQVSNEPTIARMYTNAAFLRAYWRAAQDAVNGAMQSTNYSPIIDTNNAALVANGVTVGSTSPLKDWIDGRRTFLSDELAKVASPFEISNNNGNNYTTNNANLLLAGKAPVAAAFLRINGAGTNAPVTWTSVTNWSVNWTLTNGPNPITMQGYGRTNNLLSGMSDSITITYQP